MGGRAVQSIVAQIDFRPRDLALSPYGDLVVIGAQEAVVLSAAGAAQHWNAVTRFATSPDLRAASVVHDRLAVHRETPDGTAALHLVDPATRTVSMSTGMTGTGIAKFIGPDIVCTYSRRSELTIHVGAGRADPAVHAVVVPPLASLDVRLLDDGHALLLLGHEDGRISLAELSIDAEQLRVTELWQHPAHTRPVTTVTISGGFIVSGSADRTMRLYPLRDRWEIGGHLPLHRSVRCRGMLIAGVSGPQERELLQTLIDTDQKALVS
ncbi:hypothetical protein ACFPIJ_18705 [Dactylosporangium cerinum]|uniref:WD40 repeat domain-containing protein n=1 Tax=Dactylosporangium cerinum TaxID=1434730 RepID=A0ABV9VWT1_9ACTN